MPKQLTNTELNELLLNVTNHSLHLFTETKYYFQDLYFTGCRSTEPLTISKWKIIGDKYVLKTHKTEAERSFTKSQLSRSLTYAIENSINPYSWLTFDQLTGEFRRVIKLAPIWAGDRPADTYLFRYNRARQLFEQSNNLLVVMDFFGWHSPSVASKYITTPLVYDPFRRK